MNKQELVDSVAKRLGVTKARAAEIIELLFAESGIIAAELRRGGKVAISGFGHFENIRNADSFAGMNDLDVNRGKPSVLSEELDHLVPVDRENVVLQRGSRAEFSLLDVEAVHLQPHGPCLTPGTGPVSAATGIAALSVFRLVTAPQ